MDFTHLPWRAYKKYRKDGARDLLNAGREVLFVNLFWYRLIYKHFLHARLSILSRDNLHDCSKCPLYETYDGIIRNKGPRGWNDPEVDPMAQYRPGDRFICEFPDSEIIGPTGLGITNDGRLIAETISASPQPMVDRRIGIGIGKSMLTNGIRRTLAALSNVATPDSHFETATVAIPVWNNYYHWTIECLPIIRLLDKYAENHDKYPTLLVPSDRPSWMDESLDRIDYDGPVVSWPGGVSHIENLIVPTYPDPIPAECRWLRDRMRDSHNVADDAPKRIYISRTDATVRQVENIDKIKPIFDDYGFDTIVLSELTVVEQIKLFTNAEIVVSPHGAGLTNVVYADEITVIELFGRKKMTTFARLADMLDHDYSFLNCEQRGVNLVVDPERLDTAIERAVEA